MVATRVSTHGCRKWWQLVTQSRHSVNETCILVLQLSICTTLLWAGGTKGVSHGWGWRPIYSYYLRSGHGRARTGCVHTQRLRRRGLKPPAHATACFFVISKQYFSVPWWAKVHVFQCLNKIRQKLKWEERDSLKSYFMCSPSSPHAFGIV